MSKKNFFRNLLIITGITFGVCSQFEVVYALNNEDIILEGAKYRDIYGSNYWHSSNIREWLNSRGSVEYTNQAPTYEKLSNYSYDKESGFLSNFTQSELDTIAITNTQNILSNSDSASFSKSGTQIGGCFNKTPDISFNIPGMLDYWKAIGMKNDNDKVFILSPKEIIEFYQNRGWDAIKSVTPEVRQKHGLTITNYNYFTRSARTEGFSENMLAITNDKNNPISEAKPNSSYGISPAMHLKLNKNVKITKKYLNNNFDNFKWENVNKTIKTQELKIGDIIELGNYLGKPIEWRVVNINENGFPLVVSEHILDLKPFDSPGDKSHSKSNIEFEKEDVILDPYKMTNIQGNSDNILPNIKVVNEAELHKRQIGSFTLDIEVTDNSKVAKVILPDGHIYNNPPKSFKYTIYKNGFYTIKAYDVYGNCKNFVIPVGNINLETSAIVDKSSEGWTNKPININIKASNDVVRTSSKLNIIGRDAFINPTYPNYTSYAGKKFRITGDVELKYAKRDVGNLQTGVGFMYFYTTKSGDNYVRNPTWQYAQTFKLSDLQKRGKQHIDVEYTIPENYFNELLPWLQINVDHTERDFNVEYTNMKFELLDDANFKITKIELPDGKIINDKEYSYTVYDEGALKQTYKIYDNRNMITSKTIETKIDKTNPEIEINKIDTEFTNKDVEASINFKDELSGLKEVITPFNNYTLDGKNNFSVNVKFNKNGKYYFKAIDLAGNEYTKEVSINNIDRENPKININKVFNNEEKYLDIEVSDNNEILYTQLPNGSETNQKRIKYNINKNGMYLITTKDKALNETTISVNVIELNEQSKSEIDKIEYKLSGVTNTNWIEYKTPFKITNEGVTTITARCYDKAGNISSEYTSIAKIDKTKPINSYIYIKIK